MHSFSFLKLNGKHVVFGEIVEGLEVIEKVRDVVWIKDVPLVLLYRLIILIFI